jgi:hypothetical protein
MDEVLLIAGSGNPTLADFALHCARQGRPTITIAPRDVGRRIKGLTEFCLTDDFSRNRFLTRYHERRLLGVVLFLEKRLSSRDQAVFEAVAALAKQRQVDRICVVSSFEVHLGNWQAARAEAFLLHLLQGLPARVVVLRAGHIVSANSRLGNFLRSGWPIFPVVPGRLQGCCVEGGELFGVIDRELSVSKPRTCRTYALLGPNRTWRERLREQHRGPLAYAYTVLARTFFPLAIFSFMLGVLLDFWARKSSCLRAWHLQTLYPRSIPDMLSIYNRYNCQHVKVVGYNNGVVHFGHRYLGKTVVSTVACNHRARVKGTIAEFDAGVTIRQASDVLAKHGRELPVLPNYSYVALGTSYFIPIHGSASDFTTIAETIQKVTIYDPAEDRIVAPKRQDTVFGDYLYNLSANVLLLRLQIQTKEKTRYYVNQLQVIRPSGQKILELFHDPGPSNVEIRKAGSRAETITVYKYYSQPVEGNGEALDVPRDRLGRLWDRLEENPVTRMLFHRLNRWLAYHVELFLSEADFVRFWDTHWTLPILKIQLRFIRRDGFKHSPFKQQDCISADLFMFKNQRRMFDAYLKQTLPAARLNPGKHTR